MVAGIYSSEERRDPDYDFGSLLNKASFFVFVTCIFVSHPFPFPSFQRSSTQSGPFSVQDCHTLSRAPQTKAATRATLRPCIAQLAGRLLSLDQSDARTIWLRIIPGSASLWISHRHSFPSSCPPWSILASTERSGCMDSPKTPTSLDSCVVILSVFCCLLHKLHGCSIPCLITYPGALN